MNKRIISIFTLLILSVSIFFLGFKGEEEKGKINKVNTNDQYKYFAVNQIFMWLSNNGDGSYNPATAGAGFYWPGGVNNTGKTAIFEDGLIWGAKIGREIRVGGSTYRHGWQAGRIDDNGVAVDAEDSHNRIYKIVKGWEGLPPGPERDQIEKDYNEWPITEGAPYIDVDGDGMPTPGVDQPKFVGDEVLWFVSNDMDASRTTFLYGTQPMGLEVQCTVFGFKRTGALGDMVFKSYKIINKGNNILNDMYLAYWSDTDLGDANDDLTGCDTTLSLGYTYNGSNTDGTYGTPPPSVGYDFFQGPIVEGAPEDSAKFGGEWIHGKRNLPMTAFTFYINGSAIYRDPTLGTPEGSVEMYNYMIGKVWDGTPFIDPNTGEEVKICLAGDPVAGTGWNDNFSGETGPDDRRHLMSSGPFNMSPGDTQEIVVGIVIAVGSDNINSITALKKKDDAAQTAYDLNFNLTPSPPSPKTHLVPGDRSVTIWWESNAESYDAFDPLIQRPDSIPQSEWDSTYTFEGYRVWQYRDISGSDPVLLDVSDIENGVSEFMDVVTINGTDVTVPVISAPDIGIKRFYHATTDAYSNGPLFNGNPYYFGVTAWGYSPYSAPTFLESSANVKEVLPGTNAVDNNIAYRYGDRLDLTQTSGNSDGIVRFKIIDPTSLTGHKYKIEFYGPDDSLKYRLIDQTLLSQTDTTGGKDTVKAWLLLNDRTNYVEYDYDAANQVYFIPAIDTANNPVVDGFMPLIQNIGKDSSAPSGFKYQVKRVYEVKGAGGEPVENPQNLLSGNFNSTGKYTIKAKGPLSNLVWQSNVLEQSLGYKDYEIRFDYDANLPNFYPSGDGGGFFPITANDTLAPQGNTVPFSIWDLGRNPEITNDYKRISIKILDYYRDDPTNPNRAIPDKKWSHLPNGEWEQIYAFDNPYFNGEPPLPDTSGGRNKKEYLPFGALVFQGEQPAQGTVLRVESWKPLTDGDVYEATPVAPKFDDKSYAKNNIDQITVFPNPYFGANSLERDKYQRFVRFTHLPNNVTLRIFNLSGVFIKRIDKNDNNQYIDWDLRNKDGLPVASGIYLAYLEMPGVGTKIMKIAVIMEQQYIDRL